MMRYILLLPLIISLTLSKAQTSFSDVTQASGIQHSFKVLEATFGGGATVLDYNQDGWEDVFLVGGVEGNVLYHNNGDGTFKDVSKEAGLPAIENFATQGVIAADVNKDGSVNAVDLLEIQSLILGDIDRFESNNSWRFVLKDFDFATSVMIPWGSGLNI